MRRMLFPLVLGAALLLPATAVAQTVSGEWNVSMSTPGGVRNFKMVLRAAADTLDGVIKRATGEEVPLHGTVKGNAVSFTWQINYEGNPLLLTVTATVKGDSLKGTVDFGGAAQDDFWAVRATTPPADQGAGYTASVMAPGTSIASSMVSRSRSTGMEGNRSSFR